MKKGKINPDAIAIVQRIYDELGPDVNTIPFREHGYTEFRPISLLEAVTLVDLARLAIANEKGLEDWPS